MEGEVKAWSETVMLPTYKVGMPDKNPLFLEKRVYQGSSGAIYPHAVIDRICEDKEEQPYNALFLENKYLKLMVLPEIGGRIQMALDKTNQYHFIYYNQVVKPALVGLAGPWISGGIEFNWPQHHRPSTFTPVDWRIDENLDGSKTIWCSEIETMYRTKGMHGIILYPNAAFIEIRVQLYNRTSEPQTFLWWANPAVPVSNDTQSVFPPDVEAVMDHGKRAVSNFPKATGIYYKVNYAPGIDISRHKNIPVPTSFMVYHSNFNFLGNYDYGKKAGMLHVADHHIVPGKKQWTWGNGDFGKAWERQLTDVDGPYVELMCGAFTDNQPDFSWMMSGEEKSFSQYFLPYKVIGPAQNANHEAALSMVIQNQIIRFGVYSTRSRSVLVRLFSPAGIIYEKDIELNPEIALLDEAVMLDGLSPQDITLAVYEGGHELLTYTPISETESQIPLPNTVPQKPTDIVTNEELFITGLHLEQNRHASYSPELYYSEAIRRDPYDSRCNNALGKIYYRQGRFQNAEEKFNMSINALTRRNQNPYDGESFYNLGLALKMQGRYSDAYDSFYKSVWNAAWQDVGYFELARLASRQGNFEEALDFTRRSLRRNYVHHKARHLRIGLLRRLGRTDAALRESSLALELDRMEFGAMWERYLLIQDPLFAQLSRQNPNTLVEIALDYIHAGLYLEAVALLRRIPAPDPMAGYFLGWCLQQDGDQQGAYEVVMDASKRSPDYCFPNQIECVPALRAAINSNPMDAKAFYFLGNFYYAHRNHVEAIQCWETACRLDNTFATVHRNLGLGYYNILENPERALEYYERAFELNEGDGRVLYELDQLYKKLNHPPQGRLIRLEAYSGLVEFRDDLILERISLLNLLGRYQDAFEIIKNHRFHPWEGGEGKVTGQYVFTMVELAKAFIGGGNYQLAIEALRSARSFPENLGEGKLYGVQENHLDYYLGICYHALGQTEDAHRHWETAASGFINLDMERYYDDQPPWMVYFQAMALQKLGLKAQAEESFNRMVEFGRVHLNDRCEIDYFAVSLPEFLVFNQDLNLVNKTHCHFIQGLGYLGLGQREIALHHFDSVLDLDISHQNATLNRREILQIH